jgi:hypothetical protein
MADQIETQEARINRNVEVLRQTFEPLIVSLAPDVEPAVIYWPRPTIPVTKTDQ